MSVVDRVKERLDIVEVVSRHVPLKKAGRNYKGLCPFHAEKTPSFVVFPETGTWHCFGACGTGGDVFSFIMKRENLDFSEALRVLAPMAGVSLEDERATGSANEKLRKRLLDVMKPAADHFHELLLSDIGASTRGYLAERGLTPETADQFLLGYAPDAWEALQNHMRTRGFPPSDLEAAGLVIERGDGSYYDRFRNRLVIPIHDVRGRVIAFGARLLPGKDNRESRPQPKYLNSPQTLLFDKSKEMFGLYEARQAIRAADSAIIVEGYMDVMAAHQHDVRNTVATMGTALTEQQLKRLKRYSSRFILALDPDTAGQAATLRGVQQARESLDRTWVPVPTASGLIRFEGRLDAELRIMTLPEGQDPDEVIRSDPAAWDDLVARAEPVVDYFLRLATQELDLDTAKGKSEAVRRLVPLIGEISDDVERSHYVQQLARLVHVDEQIIHSQVLQASRDRGPRRRRAAPPPPLPQPIPQKQGKLDPGGHCLAQLLYQPDLLAALDDRCNELRISTLDAEDFNGSVDQTIFAEMVEALNSDVRWDVQALGSRLEESLQERFRLLLDHGSSLPALQPSKAVDDLLVVVLRQRIARLRRRLAELQYLLEYAQGEHDQRGVQDYTTRVMEHTVSMGRLQQLLNERSWAGKRSRLL